MLYKKSKEKKKRKSHVRHSTPFFRCFFFLKHTLQAEGAGFTSASESFNTIYSWRLCDAPGSPLTVHAAGTASRGGEVHFSSGHAGAVNEISTETQPSVGALRPSGLSLARSLTHSHSHGELGSSAAAVGQQQQAPQTQPREWIAPQQRGRTSEHRLHAVPPQATLPRGLLVFETFDFRLVVADGVNLCAKHYCCECQEKDGFETEED